MDLATVETDFLAGSSFNVADVGDRYEYVSGFNRLVSPPDGYWAPFGTSTTTVSDGGYENGVQSGTLSLTRTIPTSLRDDNIKQFQDSTNHPVTGGTFKNYPVLNAGAGGETSSKVASNGWWASIPAICDISTSAAGSSEDDYAMSRNRHGALSITSASDNINGFNYLHSSADRQRIYCTPCWTPSKTTIVYGFLTTLPSVAQHQSAFSSNTTLRYEVEEADVDYLMSTWLGNSQNIQGNSTAQTLSYSGAWVTNGKVAAGDTLRTLVPNLGGNGGGSGVVVGEEVLWDGATATKVNRRTTPYPSTTISKATTATGFYDLFSSVYPFNSNTPSAGDISDARYTNWFTGKTIIFPHITDITFVQPGDTGSLVESSHPFVTVLVAIEYHGPVVPTGIRLSASAVATPT